MKLEKKMIDQMLALPDDKLWQMFQHGLSVIAKGGVPADQKLVVVLAHMISCCRKKLTHLLYIKTIL